MSEVKSPQKANEMFLKKIEERMRTSVQGKLTMADVVATLLQHYTMLDIDARHGFARMALTMFSNYENKWDGDYSEINGIWEELDETGNDFGLTVPLFTAAVDTMITNYTKVKPDYIAKPFIDNFQNRQLAKMCQEIAGSELKRMLTAGKLQREGMYLALATVSYRHIVPEIDKHSPAVPIMKRGTVEQEIEAGECPNCQQQTPTPQGNCPDCLTPVEPTKQMQTVETEREEYEKLPRPSIKIYNPVSIQPDFDAPEWDDTEFLIKRRRITRTKAEFDYQIDLSLGYTNRTPEATVLDNRQREPLSKIVNSNNVTLFSFEQYNRLQNEKVEEIQMWLKPSQYGLYFADEGFLMQSYPEGLYIKVIGNILVDYRPTNLSVEWKRLQYGYRPSSSLGKGLVHLAEMNDTINNLLSLDYAILRTHGFPVTIIDQRYINQVPEALQVFFVNNRPSEVGLGDMIHTEYPSNTSPMVGVLSQKVEGWMQHIGGIMNPTGLPQDLKQVMGTATGASSMQEMMNDRMGTLIQNRVEADIDTMFTILMYLKADQRNRILFMEKYDESTVNKFFTEIDLRGLFSFEVVKGTDQPSLESVNAFKAQTFASNAANLTGLSQYNPNLFLDIISMVGDQMNIPMEIGTGRKERNLANNKITRIKELYKQQANDPDMQMLTPENAGLVLFNAVTEKDRRVMEQIINSKMQELQGQLEQAQKATGQKADPLALMMMAQEVARRIESNLYDYPALIETYSDWVQSDEGQSAPIPIQTAVGMLYLYSIDMKEAKEQQDMQKAMLMQAGMTQATVSAGGQGGGNAPKVKRDGSVGAGRPRDMRPSNELAGGEGGD